MRCLFCKQSSDLSRSEEHIIPESIGNTKHVLPHGVVCDRCNNYFARKVEEPLLSHPSMRNIRAWYQVPNKKGIMPSLYGFVAGTDIDIALRVNKDGQLDVQPEKGRNLERLKDYFRPDAEGGLSRPLLFTLEIDPPKREMSRFLAKMALEAVALRFLNGIDSIDSLIDEPFFDDIRSYARTGRPVSDWPYYQRRIYPTETLMRHAKTGEWVQAGFGFDLFMTKRRETLFAFCLYGVEFVINVGGPSIRGYEEWLDDHNHISPLVERVGAWLTSEGEGKARKSYLHGTHSAQAGVDFDGQTRYTTDLIISELDPADFEQAQILSDEVARLLAFATVSEVWKFGWVFPGHTPSGHKEAFIGRVYTGRPVINTRVGTNIRMFLEQAWPTYRLLKEKRQLNIVFDYFVLSQLSRQPIELQLIITFVLLENLKSTFAQDQGFVFEKGYFRLKPGGKALSFETLLRRMFVAVGMSPDLSKIIELRNEIIHSGITHLNVDDRMQIYLSTQDIVRKYLVRLLGYTGSHNLYLE